MPLPTIILIHYSTITCISVQLYNNGLKDYIGDNPESVTVFYHLG